MCGSAHAVASRVGIRAIKLLVGIGCNPIFSFIRLVRSSVPLITAADEGTHPRALCGGLPSLGGGVGLLRQTCRHTVVVACPRQKSKGPSRERFGHSRGLQRDHATKLLPAAWYTRVCAVRTPIRTPGALAGSPGRSRVSSAVLHNGMVSSTPISATRPQCLPEMRRARGRFGERSNAYAPS